MALRRLSAKRVRRSTDTRARWTDATVGRTVSAREMSPLELHDTAHGGRAARRPTGRDRSSLGRFEENQLAAAEPLRDRECLVDLGVRVAAQIVDGLDLYAAHLHHA